MPDADELMNQFVPLPIPLHMVLPLRYFLQHSGRGGPTIRIVVCWIVDLNVTIRIAANCRDPDCGICASPQDPTIRIVGS